MCRTRKDSLNAKKPDVEGLCGVRNGVVCLSPAHAANQGNRPNPPASNDSPAGTEIGAIEPVNVPLLRVGPKPLILQLESLHIPRNESKGKGEGLRFAASDKSVVITAKGCPFSIVKSGMNSVNNWTALIGVTFSSVVDGT